MPLAKRRCWPLRATFTEIMLQPTARRILLLGATGTIGNATAQALLQRGFDVVCVTRREADLPKGIERRISDVTDVDTLRRDVFEDVPYDAVISCLASRTGAPADAWAVDYGANLNALTAAVEAGARHFILLSAICVQRPKLGFQQAKLAFENKLKQSGLRYSIVRPTAFFKSLSGQIARIQAGKSYLLFGDGALTACKPLSDGDLAAYLVECIDNDARWNSILPIGGPGPALTPRDMGEKLFELAGREPKFRKVPIAMMDLTIGGLTLAGKLSAPLAAKAELARIGRYYATESMLVWDASAQRYDAAKTPETGEEALFGYYEQVLKGQTDVDLADHAVF